MMEQTRIYTALKGVRGRKPVDLAALEQLMVRFSQLVVEQRWIKEIDINPLLASPERLDGPRCARGAARPERDEGSAAKLAIRPYPIAVCRAVEDRRTAPSHHSADPARKTNR